MTMEKFYKKKLERERLLITDYIKEQSSIFKRKSFSKDLKIEVLRNEVELLKEFMDDLKKSDN